MRKSDILFNVGMAVILAGFLIHARVTHAAQLPDSFPVQFAVGKLMEINEDTSQWGVRPDPMSAVEQGRLPYYPPTNYRVGIISLCLASKMGDRASYLVIPGVWSHPDRVPCSILPTPLWLRPGVPLDVVLINNSATRQYMIGVVQARVERVP